MADTTDAVSNLGIRLGHKERARDQQPGDAARRIPSRALASSSPDHHHDPRNIAETRKYVRDLIRLDQATDTPSVGRRDDRAPPGSRQPRSLWGGATAAKTEAGSSAAPAKIESPRRHTLLRSELLGPSDPLPQQREV